jgi:hypothetical protein
MGYDSIGNMRKKCIWTLSNFVWMVTETEPFESPDLTPLDICLYGWMMSEVYKRKDSTRNELRARFFLCCCRREETLPSTQTHYPLPSHTSCREQWSCCWTPEHLLWSVTNLSFLCNKFSFTHYTKIKIKLTVSIFSFFVTIHNAFVFVDSKSSISSPFWIR